MTNVFHNDDTLAQIINASSDQINLSRHNFDGLDGHENKCKKYVPSNELFYKKELEDNLKKKKDQILIIR